MSDNQVEDVTEEMAISEEKLKFEKEEEEKKTKEKELNDSKIEKEIVTNEAEEVEEIYSPEELDDMRKQAEDFKTTGNNYFTQSSFQEAIDAYTKGIDILPKKPHADMATKTLKSILYANRGACQDKLGEFQPAIDDCTLSIKTDDKYIKAYYRRGSIYEKMKDYRNALSDYKQMSEIDFQFQTKSVQDSIKRLTPLAKKQEDDERDKMMGDLKDLGNKFLGLFGLSTDNFKAQQDPTTGSYSIQFDQGASKT
jgi:tetratricopeptide (TPR) repeat protein